MSDTTTTTVQKMLAVAGFETIEALWAAASAKGVDNMEGRVLGAIASKFLDLESAENSIARSLRILPERVEREQQHSDLGWDVDPEWIAQGARQMAEAVAQRKAVCDAITMLVFILDGPKKS